MCGGGRGVGCVEVEERRDMWRGTEGCVDSAGGGAGDYCPAIFNA